MSVTGKRGFAAALALCAILALAAPASGAEKAIWGDPTLPGGGPAFPLYADLGVDTYQDILYWSDIAPTRPADPRDPGDPAYAWPARVDAAVAAAAERGIDVALLPIFTPPWANEGKDKIWAPTDPADLTDFLVAASRRYPSVRKWMIWGEPDRVDRFQPNEANKRVGPEAYAILLDAAYGALKQISPRNVVIGGMTWSGGDVKPADFIRFLRLPSGRPPRLDWFGHNPFPFRFPNLRNRPVEGGYLDISDIDTLAQELRYSFGETVPLWLSEFTVQSDQGSRVFELFVSRAEQARWLTAAYRIADSLPYVAGLGWLSLADEAGGEGSPKWGLLDSEGSPKPALRAYELAPSERFRPVVGRPRRGRRGVVVAVRARASGTARVLLVDGRGRRVRRARRRVRANRTVRVRVATRGLAAGGYQLVVLAPRGARVTRPVAIR